MKITDIKLKTDDPNHHLVIIWFANDEGYQANIKIERFIDQVLVIWTAPTNPTLENARIYQEAIGLAITTAEILETDKDGEDTIDLWVKVLKYKHGLK